MLEKRQNEQSFLCDPMDGTHMINPFHKYEEDKKCTDESSSVTSKLSSSDRSVLLPRGTNITFQKQAEKPKTNIINKFMGTIFRYEN